MKNLSAFVLLAFALGSSLLSAETVVVVTHPSTQWDFSAAAQPGVEKLYEFSKIRKLKTYTLFHDGEISISETEKKKVDVNTYYSFEKFMGQTVPSAGGQIINQDGSVKIDFKNADKVIWAGGDFRFCLCQAVNDAIKIFAHNKRPVDFYFVMDSIYFQSQSIEYPQHFPHIAEMKPTLNLRELMDPFGDSQFGSFVRGYFFMLKTTLEPTDNSIQTKEIACLHHNGGLISLNHLNLTITRRGHEVKVMGQPTGHRTRFNFITTNELNSMNWK